MSAKLLAMSLIASASSVRGTFQQHVLIDGRDELVTDEPVRLGGQGSGPARTSSFPQALRRASRRPSRPSAAGVPAATVA
jgi:hypothetical protein